MIKSLNDKKYRAFIGYLKSAREERGLTIRDLAELIDEANQTIHRIEVGERRLTVQEYMQYCRALQIEPMVGLKILDYF